MCSLVEGTVIFLVNMSSPFGCYTYVGYWIHGQDVIRGLPDIFDELRPGGQYHPRLQSGDFEYTWSCLGMGTSSTLHDEKCNDWGEGSLLYRSPL